VFTARYGLIQHTKQITFSLLKVFFVRLVYDVINIATVRQSTVNDISKGVLKNAACTFHNGRTLAFLWPVYKISSTIFDTHEKVNSWH